MASTNAIFERTTLPTYTAGGILHGQGSANYGITAAGTTGQIIKSAGSGDPTWGVATTRVGNTDTGTQNNWAPGLSGDTFIEWQGVSDLTVTGITGGIDGQIVTLRNSTASGLMNFAFNSGSSSAANRLSQFVTSGATIVASGGYITYIYDGNLGFWICVGHDQGKWIDIAYSAGNFTGSGSLVWTVDAGDQVALAYKVQGKSLAMQIYLDTTTMSGTGAEARVTIPNGYTWVRKSRFIFHRGNVALGNGASLMGCDPGNTFVSHFRDFSGNNWDVETNTVYVRSQIEAEIT